MLLLLELLELELLLELLLLLLLLGSDRDDHDRGLRDALLLGNGHGRRVLLLDGLEPDAQLILLLVTAPGSIDCEMHSTRRKNAPDAEDAGEHDQQRHRGEHDAPCADRVMEVI
jgi:hypothetical protein